MKTEKKKTLRGSALFTVVAVMAILILFLTGTLALANASNSRAHKSYSISQASYTARSAIRSFKTAMEDPTDGLGVAAAVLELGNGTRTELAPVIQMGDNSMGRLGYWDKEGNWHDDQIYLEPVSDRVDWVYSDVEDKWIPYNVVRVTATCRLGREEETVLAYISKNTEPEIQDDPVSDSDVKGLQEAGGNPYANGGDIYGGLGVSLADDPSDGVGDYLLKNSFETHTTLNFINANIKAETSSFKVYVEKSDAVPVSGTVIMGSFRTVNNEFVTLTDSYEMTKNFRQRDIPYLYIDKLMYGIADSDLSYVKSTSDTKSQPFNIYAGSMYYPYQFKAKADLYLMDPVPEINGNKKYTADGVTNYPAGENYWGVELNGNVSGSSGKELYKWADSTFGKRKDTYDSYGGNVYCNGNLTLGRCVINGNVRVAGNCTLRSGDVKINGDLVVGGELNNQTGKNIDQLVTGYVYYKDGTGEVTKTENPNYEYVENELYPGYSEVETVSFENRELEADKVKTTTEGLLCLINNETYENGTTLYYQTIPTEDGDADEFSELELITTDKITRYEVGKDGKVVFEEIDDKKIPKTTNKTHLYYDDEGDPVSEADAKGSYYRTKSEPHQMVDYSTAVTITASSKTVPLASYPYGDPYPANMTREKIYGYYDDKGKLTCDSETKLVTNLSEARKALNMNPVDGSFDETVYPFKEPTENIIASYGPETFNGKTLEVTRPADGAGWVILDNVTFQNGGGIIVKDAPGVPRVGNKQYGGGIIKFFIKGTLTFRSQCRIRVDNMPTTIKYTDDFGIEYYGWAEEDEGVITGKSHINSENNTLLVGSIKAPHMTMGVTQGDGPDTFTYVPESGGSVTIQPVLIGNALIDHLTSATNNFHLAYTRSGTGRNTSSGSGSGEIAKTGAGDFFFTYVVG